MKSKLFAFLAKLFCISLLCLGTSPTLMAQTKSKVNLTKDYLIKHQKAYKLKKKDIADLRVIDEIYDANTNVTHLYLQQQINGIEVVGSTMGAHFKNGNLAHLTTNFVQDLTKKAKRSTASISAEKAVGKVLNELAIGSTQLIQKATPRSGAKVGYTIFDKGTIAAEDIPTKLVYKKDKAGNLNLAWQIELYEKGHQHYWLMYINAENGAVIEKQDLVLSCDFGGIPMETDAPGMPAITDHSTHRHFARNRKTANRTPAIPLINAGNNALSAMVASSYRVLAEPIEAPNDPTAAFTDVVTDGDATASPYGWHSTNGSAFQNITTGNNVDAQNELGASSPPGSPANHHAMDNTSPTPAAVPPFQFHYDADLTKGPETYTDAAIVNLFYWNNIVHDIFWHFGFTEDAGNFQVENGTPNGMSGGMGGDAVIAQAQDGEGTNNANMLTLQDGTAPRMQMYLWSSAVSEDLVFLNTVDGSTSSLMYEGIEGAFGSSNKLNTVGPVSGDLVLIDANFAAPGTNEEGCGTGQGAGLVADNAADVSGKIVLIKRGSCAFVEKVDGAFKSGAIAVIVYNNTPGAGAISMGDGTGNGAAITIPSLMVSNEIGKELIDLMLTGTVNLTLKDDTPNLMVDGDFDNGIIAHEYGHGISNRLTGGPNALGSLGGDEQGGEGWSDFFALYLALQDNDLGAATAEHPNGVLPAHGIGTYVFKQDFNTGGGIRPAPYSSDLTVNPFTFGDAGGGGVISVPHGVGFIWCTMLYEMMQNIIDEKGFDNDLYKNGFSADAAGNNIALQLVMEGLKLQPTSPTFVEQRDGILKADTLHFGAAYSCQIWEAFAKRGLGVFATSGTNGLGDEVENFEKPIACGGNVGAFTTVEMTKTASSSVIDNGEHVTFDITVKNTSNGFDATNVIITDNLPTDMQFVSATDGGTHSNGVVTYPAIGTLAPGASATVSVTAALFKTGMLSTLHFEDDIESGTAKWTVTPVGSWEVDDDPFEGAANWFGSDAGAFANNTLQLANPIAITNDMELIFYHKYAMESEYDGGVLESSIDNGATWQDLGSQITQNGYNSNVPVANNPQLGGAVFSGATLGYIETRANLGALSGQNALIRFRLSTDSGTNVEGWWIDLVRIVSNATSTTNVASLAADNGVTAQTNAAVLLLESDCAGLTLYYPDVDEDGTGDANVAGVPYCTGEQPADFVDNNGDCDDADPNDIHLDLNGNIAINHYYAGNTIDTDGTVNVGGASDTTKLQAGLAIVFKPGFVIPSGANFHAFIGGDCPPSNSFTEESPFETNARFTQPAEIITEDKLMVYPNPTRDFANFEVFVGSASKVTLAVFDTRGNQVDLLVNNSPKEEGVFNMSYSTNHLAPGIYMVLLNTSKQRITQRLTVIN